MTPPDTGLSVLRNRAVLGIGLGSLLSDAGHEMATAALPGFLRSIGAPAAALGAIEGVADGALSASEVAGGMVADRPGVERRSVASSGYAITALGHGAFALANMWPFVAIARVVSWTARGGKAPARDALLAGSVRPEQLGRAFGTERAMDSIGAVIGPLAAAPLIVAIGYRWLFAVSVLPGLAAAALVLLLVHEVPRATGVGRKASGAAMRELLRFAPFRRLVIGIGLYGIGGFSATLLILHATDLLHSHGRSLTEASAAAVLLYAAHNTANALGAYPAGALADRAGRRITLIAGVAMFAMACVGFAVTSASIAVLAALFMAVGASRALVETAQGAHAAELVADPVRGRGFGLLGFVDGIGDVVANVVVGVLFTVATPAWGFLFAATFAGSGALVLAAPAVDAR